MVTARLCFRCESMNAAVSQGDHLPVRVSLQKHSGLAVPQKVTQQFTPPCISKRESRGVNRHLCTHCTDYSVIHRSLKVKTSRASINNNTQNTVHAHSEIFSCEKNKVWVYVTTWVDLENMIRDLGSH